MSSLFTPEQAIELLRIEHTPQRHTLISVVDDDGERAPTDEERAATASDLWCDGCHRAADRCTVATILALTIKP